MKKLLYFFTCISLIVALGVMSASAEALTGSCGTNVTCTLDTETGVLTISGSGEMKNFSMYVNGRAPWYDYSTDITSVNIEDGVTSIGSHAFNGCSSLTNITIPDNVTSIGESAFSGCSALTSITIPSGVTSIGNDTFWGCKSLTSLTIPEGVTHIGGMAIAGCSSLQSLSVPDSVTSIGPYAFASCEKLYNVSNGIEYVKTTTNPYFCVEDVTDYDASSVTINQEARFIDYMAMHSSSLESITIPDSVIYSINDFTNCTNLKNVYYTGDIASWLGIKFYISPCNPMSSGANLYIDGELVTEVTIPTGVTSINDSAFYNCKTLQSITIPSSITSIGKDAFKNCDNLTVYGTAGSYAQTYANSNSIPFVCSIHDFSEWAEIKQPTCTESGTKQRSCACGAVETEDIPTVAHTLTILDSVVKLPTETENGICDFACENCGYVESTPTTYVAGGTCGENANFVLDNYGSLVIYGSDAMADYSSASSRPWDSYADSIAKVVVFDGVTSIGRLAFSGYSALTTVFLSDSVKTIGVTAFFNCTSLEFVKLYDVTSIGTKAFGGCSDLTIYGLAGAYEDTYASANSITFAGHAHTENEVLIAATCTGNGLHTVTCTDCGRTLVDEILYAQGHDYIDHEAKAATCTEIGFDAYQTCSRCDYSTYSEIAALGHDYVNHEAKAQTCTESGWNAYQTCSRCDYTTYEELATLGHDYIDHEAKAATCEEYGWNAYQTCARCDYTTYDEIAALGHDDEETVLTEPTPDAPGEGMYICKVCERVEFREIPFTAHAGNIDGDGEVTVKDVMISIKAVLDGTAIDGADTNGDGKMTLLDVIQILKAAIA